MTPPRHRGQHILGLDLALGRTGYAVLYEDDGTVADCGEIVTKAGDDMAERLHAIARQVRELVTVYEPYDTWAEQCVAVGGRAGTVITLAMVHGAVLLDYGRRGDSIGYVTPGELKKLATGNGNATKSMVIEAATERWDPATITLGNLRPCRGWTDNEADALWVAEYGRRHVAAAIEQETNA